MGTCEPVFASMDAAVAAAAASAVSDAINLPFCPVCAALLICEL